MLQEIQAYLATKAAENRAKSTLYEYRLYLTAFAQWHGKELAAVNNSDLTTWLVSERIKGLADASIVARYRAVRGFLNWCVENDLLPRNPIKMKQPKIKRKRPRIATHADIQKLLTWPVGDWVDLRNRALVHLLYDTGVRVGEALSLAVVHVDGPRRLAYIPPGKDGEARTVPFTAGCATSLADYLAARPVSDLDCWLFVGSYKAKRFAPPPVAQRFTTVGARLMFKRLTAAAGLDYINPHSIRHLFATRALNAGMRVEVVSKILGHSKVDITLKVYAQLLTDTIQREYDQLWPTS